MKRAVRIGATMVAVTVVLAAAAASRGAGTPRSAGSLVVQRDAEPLTGPERDMVPVSEHPFRASDAVEPRPSAGSDGFERERLWSGYDDWEPVVAADPSGPYVYQLTTRIGGPPACKGCGKVAIIFRRSHDGGATWERDRYLLPSRIAEWDPQIRVSRDGTVYVAFLLLFRPGVTFMRSSDHGSTWTPPISFSGHNRTPPWSDRPSLAISDSGKDVYIAFNHSDSWVVASHDGGKTFGDPVQTSHERRYYFHSAGTVTPDGSVYFAAQDYAGNYHGIVHIDAIGSHDGGRRWFTSRVDIGEQTPSCDGVKGCYLGFLGPVAGLASDGRGTLLMVYNVNRLPGAPQHLYARTSRDGFFWGDATEISGTTVGVDNAFPAVAAGPATGDFRVVWMNTRLRAWDTWERRLSGGVWSTPVRLSDRRRGTPYTHRRGFAFPYGDYLGVAVGGDGVTHAIWGAGPNYNGPGGTWYTRGM